MPIFAIEQATVYRAGGRRWFTQKAAVKAYANAKFRARHRCECEQGDYSTGYAGYTCGVHVVYDKVMPRYLRVLRRSLDRPASVDAVDPSADIRESRPRA